MYKQGFLHMLPEVHEGWQKYSHENKIDINLSLGIVVICAGFFLVYFVEELAHLMADRHAHNKADVSLHRAVSIRGCPVSLEGPSPPCQSSSCNKKADGDVSCQDSTICQLDCDDKEFCRDVVAEGTCSTSKACCSTKETSISAIVQKSDSEKNFQNDGYGTFSLADSSNSHVDHDHHSISDHHGNSSLHHANQWYKLERFKSISSCHLI